MGYVDQEPFSEDEFAHMMDASWEFRVLNELRLDRHPKAVPETKRNTKLVPLATAGVSSISGHA